MKEHTEMFDRFGELMYTGTDKLLSQHQHLFLVDLVELGDGPLTDKQVWVSRMDVVILAKEKVDETAACRRKKQTDQEQGTSMDWRITRMEEHK